MNITGKVRTVRLSDIRPYPANAKLHPEGQIIAVMKSIEKFGYRQKIAVDRENVVVMGHGRLLAIRRLYADRGSDIEIEVEDCSDLSDEQIAELRIIDNKVVSNEYDETMLKKEMERVFSNLNENLQEVAERMNMQMKEITKLITNPTNAIENIGNLEKDFLIPPFSIFQARAGYWMKRKRIWKTIIGDYGQERGNAEVFSNRSFKFSPSSQKHCMDVSILDPVLAEVICTWWGMPGGLNIDPFAGDSIFGAVSGILGYSFIGTELRKEQCDFNLKVAGNVNVADKVKYHCDDGLNLREYVKPGSADLLFSCPLYFDLEEYSELDTDVSNMEFKDFCATVKEILTRGVALLKDNRFAVIVFGDVREKKTGMYLDLISFMKRVMQDAGMGLYNEIMLLDPIATASLRARGYMKNRKVAKVHQNVLVFFKGDVKQIPEIYGEIKCMDFSDVIPSENDDITSDNQD